MSDQPMQPVPPTVAGGAVAAGGTGSPAPLPAASAEQYVLTLSCPDKRGIVHAVASFLMMTGCNIVDSQQFGDRDTGLFFMRVHFTAEENVTLDALRAGFTAVGASFQMDWQMHDADSRMRVIVMVSKFGHCLNDLLFRATSRGTRDHRLLGAPERQDLVAGVAQRLGQPLPLRPAGRVGVTVGVAVGVAVGKAVGRHLRGDLSSNVPRRRCAAPERVRARVLPTCRNGRKGGRVRGSRG
jgi:predicted amino acid-binding ACT domain protein